MTFAALAREVVNLIDAELARRRMLDFSRYVMPGFIVAPHHALLCGVCDSILQREMGVVIINLPPRHTKSLLFSIHLPAMLLGQNPETQILHASYAASLSNQFSMQVRSLVRDNAAYRALFPHVTLSDERRRLDDWRTDAGGGFRSVGTGAGISGHGADVIILDDCHKEGDELSSSTMENTFNWYVSAVRTRLSPGGVIVIPMTRWHPLDLAGRIIAESGQKVDVITLPALAGQGDILGRAAGVALWPERYDEDWLNEQRRLSPKYFEALYQQNPQPDEGQLFYEKDFKRLEWTPGDVLEDAFWAIDLAIMEDQAADWTAWARFHYRDGEFLVTQIHRHQQTWPDTRAQLVDLLREYPDDLFCFPDHVLERMAVQELTRIEDGRYAAQVVKVRLDKDKRARASVFAERVRAGLVTVETGEAGDRYIQEHVLFPGSHDDLVDVSSVAAYHCGLNSPITVFGLTRRDNEHLDWNTAPI